MNPAKRAALRTQKFVTDHKVGLTAVTSSVATAAVFVKLQRSATKQWIDFMVEKGIDPNEFFNPEA